MELDIFRYGILIIGCLIVHSGSALANPVDSVTLSDFAGEGKVGQLARLSTNQPQSTVDALFDAAHRRDALIMLNVRDVSEVTRAKAIVTRALREHVDVLVEGNPRWLAELKPDNQIIWSRGQLMFISNRNASHNLVLTSLPETISSAQLSQYLIDTRGHLPEKSTHTLSVNTGSPALEKLLVADQTSIILPFPPSLSALNPEDVCKQIRDTAYAKTPPEQRQSIDNAVEKVCQSATLSHITSRSADAAVPGWQKNDVALVNLKQEWLFLVSKDPMDAAKSKAYLWAKTTAEGAGAGFTRKSAMTPEAPVDGGWFNRVRGIEYIIHPLIHSGWGPIDNTDSAWENGLPTGVFQCEKNPNAVYHGPDKNSYPISCPLKNSIILRQLLPDDSFNSSVTYAESQNWTINAALGLEVNAPPKLSVNAMWSRGITNTQQLAMVTTRSNADKIYYRSTEWSPDWRAMYTKIKPMLGLYSGPEYFSLATTTPLAATLNPKYSIVWELSLLPNAGRKLEYGSQYEVRWEGCEESNLSPASFQTPNCPKDVHGRPLEARMRWYRDSSVTLDLRAIL